MQGSTDQNRLVPDREKFQNLRPDQDQEKFPNLGPDRRADSGSLFRGISQIDFRKTHPIVDFRILKVWSRPISGIRMDEFSRKRSKSPPKNSNFEKNIWMSFPEFANRSKSTSMKLTNIICRKFEILKFFVVFRIFKFYFLTWIVTFFLYTSVIILSITPNVLGGVNETIPYT